MDEGNCGASIEGDFDGLGVVEEGKNLAREGVRRLMVGEGSYSWWRRRWRLAIRRW